VKHHDHTKIEIDYVYMLKRLIKQANGFGAKLRLYIPKSGKYDYCISGFDTKKRKMRMGGTAEWLYDTLLENMTKD